MNLTVDGEKLSRWVRNEGAAEHRSRGPFLCDLPGGRILYRIDEPCTGNRLGSQFCGVVQPIAADADRSALSGHHNPAGGLVDVKSTIQPSGGKVNRRI